jgi:hypothetical protein
MGVGGLGEEVRGLIGPKPIQEPNLYRQHALDKL